MKISGVKTTVYQYRLARCTGDASSPAGRVEDSGCLVELATDAGPTGIGIGSELIRNHVHRLVDEVLLEQDPRGVVGLWQSMLEYSRNKIHADNGLLHNAVSVLDVAMWDLKAKANGEPLWKTLGGKRPRANAYASDNALPLTDEELFQWYRMMANDFGVKGGKLKVGLDQGSDSRRLGLMRKALLQGTNEPVLMIDANECWSPKEAVRKVREMEKEYDLTWVESPTRRWNFLGLKRISDGVRSAVCHGGYLDSPGDFFPHFHHHAFDVVQVNIARTGVSGALQVADAAYGFELPVTLGNSPGNIHAHLAGVMPYFMSMEVMDPVPPEGFFSTDVRIEDGRTVVGDKPGHGLEIDQEALAKASKEVEE